MRYLKESLFLTPICGLDIFSLTPPPLPSFMPPKGLRKWGIRDCFGAAGCLLEIV